MEARKCIQNGHPSEKLSVTYTTSNMSDMSVKSTRRFQGKIYKGLKGLKG